MGPARHPSREELWSDVCDDISRSRGLQRAASSDKASATTGPGQRQYFSWLEPDGPRGPLSTTCAHGAGPTPGQGPPTHGLEVTSDLFHAPEYNWMAETKEPIMGKRGSRDSDNSLLRYLSDDKILVIEEEPEGPVRESRRTHASLPPQEPQPQQPQLPPQPVHAVVHAAGWTRPPRHFLCQL
ncbi:unnamed protein product [Gadus morhua 'NCC']